MVGYSTGGQNISGQFGMPLFGISGLPAFTGNYYWVDGTNGSDGNTGGPQDPLKTLTQALAQCVAGNNDVVLFTGTFSPSATFTWSKNNTHLIGLGQAVISVANPAATTGALSPLVNVTAQGCIFQNFTVVSGIAQAATQVAWAEAGGDNVYTAVTINQVANATAGAQAGNRALTVASKSNVFTNCIVGGDQVIRATAASANLEFLAGSGDNIFDTCVFPMWSSVATTVFATAATATMSGFTMFKNCLFALNLQGAGSVGTLTVGMTINATAGGVVMLQDTAMIGATATGAGAPVYTNLPASNAAGGRVTAAV